MKRKIPMRLLPVLFCAVFSAFCQGQTLPDSVIMVVGGKEIPFAEFEYMALKNQEVDLNDKSSLDAYVDLFKKFKLKVVDAENAGYDKKDSFNEEFNRYKSELTSSYLSDPAGEEAFVKQIYERGNKALQLSYILFRFPGKVVTKDTVAIYEEAHKAYLRILKGEDFDEVGQALGKTEDKSVIYEYVHSLAPLNAPKAFDQVAFAMKDGELSLPVRTTYGYYLIKLHKQKTNTEQVKVAHILFRVEGDTDEKSVLEKANQVRQQALAGGDFQELAKEYSQDSGSAGKGGEIPFIRRGVTYASFEDAIFQMKEIGEISEPIKTPVGYHIVKLLDRKPRSSFEEEKGDIASVLKRGEWNFELYNSFDSRMKKEYGYTFYPERYAELQSICDLYFPTDSLFSAGVAKMDGVLFVAGGQSLTQKDFVNYLLSHPYSIKNYSVDFMQEVYDLFVRDVLKTLEKRNLTKKYPEYNHLLQEYRDGILLFEISNERVWEHPVGEQSRLENEWMEELQKKYPVIVNTRLLKKIKK